MRNFQLMLIKFVTIANESWKTTVFAAKLLCYKNTERARERERYDWRTEEPNLYLGKLVCICIWERAYSFCVHKMISKCDATKSKIVFEQHKPTAHRKLFNLYLYFYFYSAMNRINLICLNASMEFRFSFHLLAFICYGLHFQQRFIHQLQTAQSFRFM